MCGINGIAYAKDSGRSVDRGLLAGMRDCMHHRGPDDSGEYFDKNIALGHRRLSIIDVRHGHQPIFNPDESLAIVYNGEVYNHAEHRPELEAKGYKYRTTSDTETILFLYEEYGPRCVEFMRGMFSFAVWDKRRKRMFIARDRLGIKPLYYVYDDEGNLYFASEIKALLRAGAVKAELNYAVLPDQFANPGTSAEETLFRGVKRLLPGHYLIWQDGRITIRKYWDVAFEPKSSGKSDAEFVEEWRELFQESVRLRLMADVPLGMFLSGGIDSSAICAMMAGMVAKPIKTFSVGFKEREANEFEYARIVSRAFGTDHHEITITPEEYFGALPKMIWHEDEPLGFVASIPLYFVAKLAQEQVKVVLTGEGSDEMLGGYARYQKTLMLLNYGRKYEELAPAGLRGLIKRNLGSLPFKRKLERTFLALPADIESLYFNNFAIFPQALQARLFTEETKAQISDLNPFTELNNWLTKTDADNLLDRLLYADSKMYLHELLMKQDQMSMAASIESRVPFLDHRLVEYTAHLRQDLKIRKGETKWILREAMRGILPNEILNRPKMGFPVPVGQWFRNEFKHIIDEYVLSERTLARGIFQPDVIREIVEQHNAGENFDLKLWSLVNFEIWHRQFIDGESLFDSEKAETIQRDDFRF